MLFEIFHFPLALFSPRASRYLYDSTKKDLVSASSSPKVRHYRGYLRTVVRNDIYRLLSNALPAGNGRPLFYAKVAGQTGLHQPLQVRASGYLGRFVRQPAPGLNDAFPAVP
jgi:hypothetical protein